MSVSELSDAAFVLFVIPGTDRESPYFLENSCVFAGVFYCINKNHQLCRRVTFKFSTNLINFYRALIIFKIVI
jgi:hypothetical protein